MRNQREDIGVLLLAIGYSIAIFLIIALLSGCANKGLPLQSACTVEAERERCWTVKSKGLGRYLSEMEGEFCINKEDTRRLLRRLAECESTDLPVVGRSFESLCVIEAKAGMCWIKKSGGTGRPFSAMEGNHCVDRPDLERILYKLNECANR